MRYPIFLFLVTLTITYAATFDDKKLIGLDQITAKIKLEEIEAFLMKTLKEKESSCIVQLLWIVQGIQKGDIWTLKLFDSWSKPNAGYLSGNLVALGAYDQCLKFSHNVTSKEQFKGQYCNVVTPIIMKESQKKLVVNQKAPKKELEIPLTFGVCIPRICEPKFFKKILDQFGQTINILIGEYDQDLNCNDGIDPDFTSADIGAITILSGICALILASTIYDILTLKNTSRVELFLSFSFYTNLIILFKTTPQNVSVIDKKSNIIGCLNGIRCLSMIWVMFSHRVTSFVRGPVINSVYISDWIKLYPSMLVVAAGVAVDTFFILSGFLVTLSILKELDRKKTINIPYMYLHRYLRLTPSLAMLILIHVSLYKYIGSGPFWKVGVDYQAEPCIKKWWTNLLYFHNYYKNLEERCMGHSWYLAIDMQLFILVPLLVWPLWKYGRNMLFAIIGLLCFGLLTNFTYFFVGQYHYSLGANDNRILRTYEATHTRMVPWIVGLLLAYLIHWQKDKEIKHHWGIVFAGWFITLTTIMAIIFGIQPITQLDYQNHSQWKDTMYGTFSIFSWSLSVSWIIYACINGYGGFINSFLSWTFWQPMAKLTYSMYLLHFSWQFTHIFSTKTHFNFSNVNSTYMFWGDLGFTITLAIVWTLAFESPVLIIEKYIFSRKKTHVKIDTERTRKDVMA